MLDSHITTHHQTLAWHTVSSIYTVIKGVTCACEGGSTAALVFFEDVNAFGEAGKSLSALLRLEVSEVLTPDSDPLPADGGV